MQKCRLFHFYSKMHMNIICSENNNKINRLRKKKIDELINKNSIVVDLFNAGEFPMLFKLFYEEIVEPVKKEI